MLTARSRFATIRPVPFTAASKDTIEGVVTVPPSSVNQVFDIAVTDASFAASNSLLNGSLHPGDLVTVGVVTPQPFFVVSEGLTIPTNSFSGSTDVSPIQPGQTRCHLRSLASSRRMGAVRLLQPPPTALRSVSAA